VTVPPTIRAYLPLTAVDLAAAVASGLPGPHLAAHAATESLRSALPDEDDSEVLEYYALMLAADESAAAVRAGSVSPARRVVLAADVDQSEVVADPERGPGAVRVAGPVPWQRVAALHVDEAAAEPTVAAAGDTDQFELLWYAPQEAAGLAAELSRG
jgi:hypothetical protein